jgi:tetratricopeptide (TPR) repeat protein
VIGCSAGSRRRREYLLTIGADAPYSQINLRRGDSDMLWTWRTTDGLYQPATAARALEWMRKAQECEAQSRQASAIKAYEHAARSPDRGMAAIANYHLGRLYEQRRRFTSAIRAYRRAGNCTDLGLRTSACYHLGRLYEHRHHRARAIVAYRRAIRAGNGDDAARAGTALERLGA